MKLSMGYQQSMSESIQSAALKVLQTPDPIAKTACARKVAADWFEGRLAISVEGESIVPPERPSRPICPELKSPGKVPRRRLSSVQGRVALLHAVAHIEFNAVDLAFDLVARFGSSARINDSDRSDFISDWVRVGDDEARHFNLICDRLSDFGANYGDLPAHDGLWDAARSTAHDLAARLAIAPMVLEARGLDVTPSIMDRLRAVDDHASVDVLNVIYTEEVAHVAAGRKWFESICARESLDPEREFHRLVRAYFKADLKRPFNVPARSEAGIPRDWYEPLAEME
jgi:uncharacterized ferritin-like protein (DUF455 family)